MKILNFFFIIFTFSNLFSTKENTKNIKKKENKEEKNLKNNLKDTKKFFSSEKKDLETVKNSVKINPPSNEYFSNIIIPEKISELDEKISEGIKYGAQSLILITWSGTAFNNSFYISQVLESFSESESIFNSYRTILACVQVDESDLIEIPISLGMPNPPSNDWCISISATVLPKKALPSGKSYFGYSENSPLTKSKLLMSNNDILQGNSTDKTCGKKKNDPCYVTNIKLTGDLSNKITQALQAYLASIPLYPIEYNSSILKSAKKGFKNLNKTILDRINTKTAQIQNYKDYTETTYNEKNTENKKKPKEGLLGKATFGVL